MLDYGDDGDDLFPDARSIEKLSPILTFFIRQFAGMNQNDQRTYFSKRQKSESPSGLVVMKGDSCSKGHEF